MVACNGGSINEYSYACGVLSITRGNIIECNFINNSNYASSKNISIRGGALYTYYCLIKKCNFLNNNALNGYDIYIHTEYYSDTFKHTESWIFQMYQGTKIYIHTEYIHTESSYIYTQKMKIISSFWILTKIVKKILVYLLIILLF